MPAIMSPTPVFDGFKNGSGDNVITTFSWVQDGARILGVLYGSSPDTPQSPQHERIFARWLQKKVLFVNSATQVRLGDIELANGPNKVQVQLAAGKNVETGAFEIYDTDGETLLFRSPRVTMRAGDIWSYDPGY
jgi:hypothetical protein